MNLKWYFSVNRVRDAEERKKTHAAVLNRSVAYLSPNTSAWQGLGNNK